MHVSTQTLIWLTASLILSGIFFYAEDTAPHNSLGTDEPVTLRFTSGAGNETGRQRVLMKLEPGRYRLQMTQEGSRYSDQWLIWDYLALEADKDPVWKIGRDDTGSDSPDYSEKAFSEFSRKGAPDETTHFVVGQTQAKNFCRELNDNDRTDASIEFSVSEEDSKKKLTLWQQHVRRPRFQQVRCVRWGRFLPVIVSFEKFNSPEFPSAFPSLPFSSRSGLVRSGMSSGRQHGGRAEGQKCSAAVAAVS